MKTIRPLFFTLLLVLACGCTQRAKEADKAKQDADAKARADAAKKEMDTLPKVFSTPNYFKKNTPSSSTDATAKSPDPASKS